MSSAPASSSTVTPNLLIVWWSVTGAARALAHAAAAGAAGEVQIPARLVRCDQATANDLLQAGGLIIACPEMLGSMAGQMKEFFDRTYYSVIDRIAGRPYAVMIAAGSDGQGAARQIARIATGWRLREVAAPLIVCTQAQTAAAIQAPKTVPPSELARANELGAMLAAGLSIGMW